MGESERGRERGRARESKMTHLSTHTRTGDKILGLAQV